MASYILKGNTNLSYHGETHLRSPSHKRKQFTE